MPKPKCPDCDGLGLIVREEGNTWCHCPVGREYVETIAQVRREIFTRPARRKRARPVIN